MAEIPTGFIKLATIGIRARGEWQENETYYLLNLVSYEGSSYIARIDNPTSIPSENDEEWQIISQRGEKGLDGAGGVTSVMGEAESEPRSGDVVITKENLGLENVENKSASDILGELTKEQIETLLETTDLKETIETIIASLEEYPQPEEIVTGLRGEAEEEFRHGEVVLSKEDLGLTFEEILDHINQNADADLVDAVAKAKDNLTRILYGADTDQNTIHLKLMERYESLAALFDSIYRQDKETEVDALLEETFSDILITGPVLKFLLYEYKEWLEIRVLEDLHPVTGIKLEGEDFYRTGLVNFTSDDLNFDFADITNPDTKGLGIVFGGMCSDDSEVVYKEVQTQEGFKVREGRLILVNFTEDNTAEEFYLIVGEAEPYPVYINGKPVTTWNKETFKRGGSYLFQYGDSCWNLIIGTNMVRDRRELMLDMDLWEGVSSPYSYPLEIQGVNDEMDINIWLSNSASQNERVVWNGLCFIDSEFTENGVILKVLDKPDISIPISVDVTY